MAALAAAVAPSSLSHHHFLHLIRLSFTSGEILNA
jgi:hypothetical protein